MLVGKLEFKEHNYMFNSYEMELYSVDVNLQQKLTCKISCRYSNTLKVPKRENFSLAFFALSEPIWVCDLGSGKKIDFFIK